MFQSPHHILVLCPRTHKSMDFAVLAFSSFYQKDEVCYRPVKLLIGPFIYISALLTLHLTNLLLLT
jgi:hypothetical protein